MTSMDDQQMVISAGSGPSWGGNAAVHAFAPGTVIYAEGDRAERIYRVLDGRVTLDRATSEGTHWLLHVLGPGDVFGEVGVLDGGPHEHTATAVELVRAVVLQRAELARHCRADALAAQELLQFMARRVRHTTDEMADLMSATVSARTAKHLLRLSQQFGGSAANGRQLAPVLTQLQLAQLVGSVRESVNKALGEFAGRGWIRLDGQDIVILDSGALADEAASVRRRRGAAAHGRHTRRR